MKPYTLRIDRHDDMTDRTDPIDDVASPEGRYARQVAYSNVGADGQRRLAAARVALIGCGGLGTMLANIMVRAGVGCLRIVDGDRVERDNLQRQVLFDDRDAVEGAFKATAARAKLAVVNPDVAIEAQSVRATRHNIERLVEDADLILDGTDNFETRYLINDVAVKRALPWVYGGVVADYGSVMPVVPGQTACLRCLFRDPPPPGETATCETAGILASAAAAIASFQAVEAIKILTGRLDALNRHWLTLDVWAARLDTLDASSDRRAPDCPCCALGRFEFLDES